MNQPNLDSIRGIAPHQGQQHALQDWAVAGGVTLLTVVLMLGTMTALRRDGMAAGPAVASGCVVGGGALIGAGAVFDRYRRQSRTAGYLAASSREEKE